jgi:fructose-bisphosphate aldolase class I
MLTTAPRAEPSAEDAPAMAVLESPALAATRAAALACRRWVGRGRARDADAAVAEAMRATLAEAPGPGTVVVGQGAKGDIKIDTGVEPLAGADGENREVGARFAKWRAVPAAVPGIAFLSGGRSDELASAHLSAINAAGDAPWDLSFSYDRALQAAALKAWAGREDDVREAQAVFEHRARCNAEARHGRYTQEPEHARAVPA